MKDCSDDDGSDNPTLQVAAVALRPIGNSGLSPDSSGEYPYVVKRTTFSVEVKSVAIMVPQWIARFPLDSVPPGEGEELYAGIIAPRVDTFSITLSQITGRFHLENTSDVHEPDARWTVCDPGGPAVSEGDGPGFWGFAHARHKWMDIRRWTPAGGSWDRIIALADSTRGAATAPQ